MEIKTLAQILAENSTSTQGSRNKDEQNKSHRKPHKKPRAQSSSARGFAVSENDIPSNHTASNHAPSKHTRSDSKKHTKDTYNLKGKKNSNNSQFNNNASIKNSDSSDISNLLDITKNLASQESSKNNPYRSNKRKKKKTFHPASPYQPKIASTPPVKEVNPNSIKNLLAQVKAEGSASSNDTVTSQAEVETIQTKHCDTGDLSRLDNLPAALKAYLKTPEQRQAEKEEIKANSRLRWLAFYYLSRREHSAEELRQKLIDKEQDPVKIDELLVEFAEKGYQSDYRTALMLIREGIRKRYGRVRIKNDFYKRKVAMPSNIDELIDMAMDDNEEFADVLSDNDLVEGVDWLRLAVEARVKKYGEDIPNEQKEKARQLRFLQYRGFQPDICFEAIKYNLKTLEDRF